MTAPPSPKRWWVEFTRILQEAGIHLPRPDAHKHTPSCHVYGFHDFRRDFATVNAPQMKPEVLQRLMRHKSYQTTQKCHINSTNQMQVAVSQIPVPASVQKDEPAPNAKPAGDEEKKEPQQMYFCPLSHGKQTERKTVVGLW